MKQHLQSLKIIVFGLVFVLGVSYAQAAWIGPTLPPPDGNVAAPIHVGAVSQIKDGGLGINSLAVYGDSYFQGNVGIGTTRPGAALHITKSGGDEIRITDSAPQIKFEDNTPGSYDYWIHNNSDRLYFLTDGGLGGGWTGDRPLTIHRDKVGIGTVSPSQRLEVVGNIKGSGFCLGTDCITSWPTGGGISSESDTLQSVTNRGATTNIGITAPIFYDRNNTAYYVDPNGTSKFNTVFSRVYYYSSDEQLKEQIKTLDGLDLIRRLRGVSFRWKDTGKLSAGLVAQEVEEVLPELVTTDEETGLKSIQYGNLVAPLIEAVKAQQKQIEELEREVQALKSVLGNK